MINFYGGYCIMCHLLHVAMNNAKFSGLGMVQHGQYFKSTTEQEKGSRFQRFKNL